MLTSSDFDAILKGGSKPCIDFLRYCVMSIAPEPVFIFLTTEFHMRPGHAAALALYDVFCAQGAPARVGAPGVLPPRDLMLSSAIAPIRRQWESSQLRSDAAPAAAAPNIVPYKHMFDFVVEALRKDEAGGFANACGRYDPQLDPEQNLPDGAMNEAQRHFVERIWKRVARPRLVEAGFWRIANIE